MKRILVILSVFSLFININAQEFNPSIKMDVTFCGSDLGVMSTEKFIGDFIINENLTVGPGIGLGFVAFDAYHRTYSKYDYGFIMPVFANAKWFINPQKRICPFIHTQIGYTFYWLDQPLTIFGFDKDKTYIDRTGFYLAAGPGVDIALKRGSLQVSIDWNLQKVRYKHSDLFWKSENLLGFSIGYSWGKR